MMQTAGVALLAALVILLLREARSSVALSAKMAATLFFFCAALPLYVLILGRVEAIFAESGAADYATPLLRAAGVALICEITAAVCRDLGENGVAGGVQMLGKLEILVLCLPMVDDVLEIAKELLKF